MTANSPNSKRHPGGRQYHRRWISNPFRCRTKRTNPVPETPMLLRHEATRPQTGRKRRRVPARTNLRTTRAGSRRRLEAAAIWTSEHSASRRRRRCLMFEREADQEQETISNCRRRLADADSNDQKSSEPPCEPPIVGTINRILIAAVPACPVLRPRRRTYR